MKCAIGYSDDFEVRHEYYYLAGAAISVLYLSDFHFNRFSRPLVIRIIEKIARLNPTLILLGGDYVDSRKGLAHLKALMAALADHKNVFAVAGNHDYFFGINEIRAAITANGAGWIEQESKNVQLGNVSIQIDGNHPEATDTGADFSILLLHKPVDLSAYKARWDIAFAGHLHGCQVVLWQTAEGLYPGRIFYKWNQLQAAVGRCRYYISKGLGDTLPLRFNCPKDMIFVTIAAN